MLKCLYKGMIKLRLSLFSLVKRTYITGIPTRLTIILNSVFPTPIQWGLLSGQVKDRFQVKIGFFSLVFFSTSFFSRGTSNSRLHPQRDLHVWPFFFLWNLCIGIRSSQVCFNTLILLLEAKLNAYFSNPKVINNELSSLCSIATCNLGISRGKWLVRTHIYIIHVLNTNVKFIEMQTSLNGSAPSNDSVDQCRQTPNKYVPHSLFVLLEFVRILHIGIRSFPLCNKRIS